MSDEILQHIRQAVLQMRSTGCPHKLEAMIAPNVHEYLKGRDQAASLFMQFEGIPVVVLPELPDDEMVIVSEGTPKEIIIELAKERRRQENAKKQFIIADERQAEWLNYLERKKYLVVVETKTENDQLVRVIDFTEEGKRYLDSEKGEQDRNWFFETGKLPRE